MMGQRARDQGRLFYEFNLCHRQWETDPVGTSNLTHRSWCPPRSGGGDVDGGGTDGDYGFIEARREHPRDCQGHGRVSQHGAALLSRGGGGGDKKKKDKKKKTKKEKEPAE